MLLTIGEAHAELLASLKIVFNFLANDRQLCLHLLIIMEQHRQFVAGQKITPAHTRAIQTKYTFPNSIASTCHSTCADWG